MANYAYIDRERTQKIYAYSDGIMQYKSVRCFCKNPDCDAKMFVYMPEHKNSAYFKASGKPGHTGACGISPKHFSINDYVEKDFNFPQNLLNLLNVPKSCGKTVQRNGESGISMRPLTGLKETYTMLTNTEINDCYNGYKIRDMIADERTEAYYHNGIEGYKVVECNFYKFAAETSVITMNYPCFPHRTRSLELWFNDKILFRSILRRIQGKNHNGIVVVFGDWKLDGQANYVNILSEKQIAVIRKES